MPSAPSAMDATAAARSFIEVADQPATMEKSFAISTPWTAMTAKTVATGLRAQKGNQPNLKKITKTSLVASRVSQHSALLSKKRALVVVVTLAVTTSAAVDAKAPPEGQQGGSRLGSLDIILDASPPSPPHHCLHPLMNQCCPR